MTSSVGRNSDHRKITEMAGSSFVTSYDAKCSAFRITRLIYVHCVSKENFGVHLKGFSCVTLCCKEIHWSYLENMQERRVCLVPKYIDDRSAEELFDGLSSPVLIRINSSCDITFVNPEGDNSEELTRAIIWDLEVLRRNFAAAMVPASTIQQEKAIDSFCHPVDLTRTECNCGNFSASASCLVRFIPRDESGLEPPNLESLHLSDDDDDEKSDEQDSEHESNDELHAEVFKVKGSFHEERYQKALVMCDNSKRKNQAVPVCVEFAPDNIEDRNAIKIEVYFDNDWHAIGYCGVAKIPKLRKAMKGKEIARLSLLHIKREWIPWQSKFSFYTSVNIVKRGQWEKDSPKNYYNSNLDV